MSLDNEPGELAGLTDRQLLEQITALVRYPTVLFPLDFNGLPHPILQPGMVSHSEIYLTLPGRDRLSLEARALDLNTMSIAFVLDGNYRSVTRNVRIFPKVRAV
jgi:glycyl-tRNA synthetase beta subunit